MDAWEADRPFLEKHAQYKMVISDQHFVLLHICPGDLPKEILKDYNLGGDPEYHTLEQKIAEFSGETRTLR